MATKVAVVLEDDLEDGPPDETVRFGTGATGYEIDRGAKNATPYRGSSLLQRWKPGDLLWPGA
jgi:Lsr2